MPPDVQTAVDKFPLIPLPIKEATVEVQDYHIEYRFPLIPLPIKEATYSLSLLIAAASWVSINSTSYKRSDYVAILVKFTMEESKVSINSTSYKRSDMAGLNLILTKPFGFH